MLMNTNHLYPIFHWNLVVSMISCTPWAEKKQRLDLLTTISLNTSLNSLETGNCCDNLCVVICSRPRDYYEHRGDMSLRLLSNSETNASELLGNPDEMFPRYYIHSDIYGIFKPSNSTILCSISKISCLLLLVRRPYRYKYSRNRNAENYFDNERSYHYLFITR